MATRTDTQLVHTPLGDFEGAVRDGVAAFLGIPYARPPFGPRRFRAPEPVGPHEGVRPCFDYGPTAPKPPYPAPINELLIEVEIPGEDCLNLNIWTPADAAESSSPGGPAASTGRPVFVWIHGGAFRNGSNSMPLYDGSAFARDGVVAVAINYRLGVDGFLQLDGTPANRGLLDQIAALEWVRDNIAGFGGDPDRVTVAGESAGAMSVCSLLAMPRAEGLFRQAIAQSGAGEHALTAATAARVTAGLAATLGIEPTAEAFAAVPLPELVAGQQQFSNAVALERDESKWGEIVRQSLPLAPVIDGDSLPARPQTAVTTGAGSGVRLLIGTNRDEMTLFLVPTGLLELTDPAVLDLTAASYGLTPEGLAAYRETRPEASVGELIVDSVGDWFFRVPAIRIAEARTARADAATYMYEFGWRTTAWEGKLRSTHALEIAFVFDHLDEGDSARLLGTAPPAALAREMHAAWVDFVTTGDPGWPEYGAERRVQTFADETELVSDPRSEARRAWDGLR